MLNSQKWTFSNTLHSSLSICPADYSILWYKINSLSVWMGNHPEGIVCLFLVAFPLSTLCHPLLISFFDPHCLSFCLCLPIFISLSKCATVSSFALRDWSSYQGELFMATMNKRCCAVSNDSGLIWKQSEIFGQKRIEWSVFTSLLFANTCQWNQLQRRPMRLWGVEEKRKKVRRNENKKQIWGNERECKWNKGLKFNLYLLFSPIFLFIVYNVTTINSEPLRDVQVSLWNANGMVNRCVTTIYFILHSEDKIWGVNASWVTFWPIPLQHTHECLCQKP